MEILCLLTDEEHSLSKSELGEMLRLYRIAKYHNGTPLENPRTLADTVEDMLNVRDNEKDIKSGKQSEIIIYQTEDGNTKKDVKFEDETVWLTQAQLCELYQTNKSNISEHIKHIFEEGELDEISVVRKLRTTGADGKNYNIIHYNLDMIISLSYRVKSLIATKFRRWATERLKEYMIKSFTMDDERLKSLGGGNYWQELWIIIQKALNQLLFLGGGDPGLWMYLWVEK